MTEGQRNASKGALEGGGSRRPGTCRPALASTQPGAHFLSRVSEGALEGAGRCGPGALVAAVGPVLGSGWPGPR